ncbi:hypothetical protein [uncultured Winogradskyella sp.]|uniref:hypothetical protein n=1 Tax=uncultured Winogradskyella sp. TaxID=395353 RepID=UPI0026355A2E|nr:hypothetical protein [uncultured Winogradskyella sp.]
MNNKFLSVIVCIALMVISFSCERDEEVAPEQDSILKGYYTKLKRIKHSKKIQKVSSLFSAEKNNTDNGYNFTIDTNFVQTIEAEDYVSYTFIAEKDSIDTNALHNYVVTFYNDDRVHQMLVRYPLLGLNSYQYNMDAITAEAVSGDLSILQKTGCPDGYPVTHWDPNQNCIDYYCGVGGGDGSHGPGQSCDNGDQVAYRECSGAWVTTCMPDESITPGEPGNAGGGGGGSNDSDDIGVVPVDRCIQMQMIDPNYDCNSDLEEIECQIDTSLASRINDLEDSNLINQINTYLSINDNSCQANNFVSIALDAIENGDEVDFELQNINKLTNPCARQIFNELEEGIYEDDVLSPEVSLPPTDPVGANIILNFSETILLLFNNSDSVQYTIQNQDYDGGSAYTVITTTTLNNSYLAEATKLSIARTMIHELIHAYLNSVYYNYSGFENNSLRDKLRQFAIDNGFTDLNTFHHEFMGQYVNAIAYALYEWDRDYGTGGALGWDYYYSMGWGGLFQTNQEGVIMAETDTFVENVPSSSDRQNIALIVFNETKGNNDAQGTNCN